MKDRTAVAVLLAGSRHNYMQMARPLLKALEATQHFHLEGVTDASVPPLQSQGLPAASDHALLPREASQLADFVRLVQRTRLFAAGGNAAPSTGVGLPGYGAIARAHAASIAATPGLSLAGVCDISDERRKLAASEWSVRTHARAEEMLEDPDVGLVVVGTPPSVHFDSVMAALRAGKHVVCEKPFAIRVEEVDRMIDAASAGNRVLSVYQSRRWDPDYLALRDVVRSGQIG